MARRTITLTFSNGGLVVPAHVFGSWAAHESHSRYACPGWRVTHVQSGLSLSEYADDLSRNDAIGLARALRRRVPSIEVNDLSISNETAHLIAATVGEYLGEGSVL